MSSDTEDKLRDWVLWYKEHEKQIPEEAVYKRLEFLTKALDGAFELLTMLTIDMQKVERRDPRNRLWLPSSVKIDDGPPVRLRD